MFGAQDYDAELAERYGWINRALPASELSDFVRSLAHRIAKFPSVKLVATKNRVNAIALAPVRGFSSRLRPIRRTGAKAQNRFPAEFKRGLQIRAAERDLAHLLE